MKKIVTCTSLLIISTSLLALSNKKTQSINKDIERTVFEHLQTRDINTNTVPKERMYQALEQLANENTLNATQRSNGIQALTQPRWLEIGPTNVAGRVRAFILLPNNTAWAGGINGGLFKARNINNSNLVDWRNTNDRFEKLNITSFAVHPTNANIL